ncbi:MAG TPA: hypothetical protein VFW29_00375 [Solirubrobacteraceae bacterium]|nr:hypothetical protein [Solirubrobacteraceae bacterium]
MTSVRRFQIDELTLRPGTYFNPETEIMIVVDDSPEVDHEIFESEELESTEWVLIAEDIPLDENLRDDLVERFQRSHQEGADMLDDGDDLGDEDEDDGDGDEDEDEEDELDGVEELGFEE